MSDPLGARMYPNEAAPDRREGWRPAWPDSGLLTNLNPAEAAAALAAWDPVQPVAKEPPAAKAAAKIKAWYTR
jgi:hypothetical protein